MSLVLMTQIGFVAIVEQAPPHNEAYTLAKNQLSSFISVAVVPVLSKGLLTRFRPEESLCFVVDGEIDGPCGDVT